MSGNNIELFINDRLARPTGKFTLNEANDAMANKRKFSGGSKKQKGGNNVTVPAEEQDVQGASPETKSAMKSLMEVSNQQKANSLGAKAAEQQTGGKTRKSKKTRKGKKARKGKKTKRRKTTRKRRQRR